EEEEILIESLSEKFEGLLLIIVLIKVFTCFLFVAQKDYEDESTKIAFGNLRSEKHKIPLSLEKEADKRNLMNGPGLKRMQSEEESHLASEEGTFDEIKIVNAAIDEAVEKLLNEAVRDRDK
ncbi:hypothetical protein ACJX0J_016268, partial [Zea mays]